MYQPWMPEDMSGIFRSSTPSFWDWGVSVAWNFPNKTFWLSRKILFLLISTFPTLIVKVYLITYYFMRVLGVQFRSSGFAGKHFFLLIILDSIYCHFLTHTGWSHVTHGCGWVLHSLTNRKAQDNKEFIRKHFSMTSAAFI